MLLGRDVPPQVVAVSGSAVSGDPSGLLLRLTTAATGGAQPIQVLLSAEEVTMLAGALGRLMIICLPGSIVRCSRGKVFTVEQIRELLQDALEFPPVGKERESLAVGAVEDAGP